MNNLISFNLFSPRINLYFVFLVQILEEHVTLIKPTTPTKSLDNSDQLIGEVFSNSSVEVPRVGPSGNSKDPSAGAPKKHAGKGPKEPSGEAKHPEEPQMSSPVLMLVLTARKSLFPTGTLNIR